MQEIKNKIINPMPCSVCGASAITHEDWDGYRTTCSVYPWHSIAIANTRHDSILKWNGMHEVKR